MSRIDNIAKSFEPLENEKRIYGEWIERGYFHATIDEKKTPYTIVIPPPNITGQLHMGHALDTTIQDVLIRWKRMQGYSALWMPGTDHASIATEARIVDAMAKEGITKDDIGREKFLEKAWQWKDEYGGRIVDQLKRLGSSCDWERERFTMDEGLSGAVNKVFIDLYEKGLIYRGERIINWCPTCLTSISDAEVEFEEEQSKLWHIKYPFAEKEGYLVVATTRPETMFGDTAVAVAPDDERYKNVVGDYVILPLTGRKIQIIEDEYVEKDFGTGVVKMTPAHDPNDFEVGLRHNLEVLTVINDNGTMNEHALKYAGMDRFKARELVVLDLTEQGYIEKEEDYTHNIGQCYRCNTTVEPKVSFQWFVKMQPLAKPAIDAVKSKETEFVPERFEKIYFNWMENIKDWCISRQLWWGHQIPAYYCDSCKKVYVGDSAPDKCSDCNDVTFTQDPDTLDTWFSSALWPFSTLGWPQMTEEFKYFYPTNVLVTGYDIIFFWVARMIFSALEHTNQVPFKHVFIHGIVRDEKGRKMSKSLGNGIDPLEIIDEFGADALRFSLINGSSPGSDQRFLPIKVESGRNFSNKIWNAFRFVVMNFEDDLEFSNTNDLKFTMEDKWILSRLNTIIAEVTNNLDNFEMGVALGKIYSFIWEEFCDWYIEMVKPRLFDKENETRYTAQYVLNYVLCNSMKLLHPYMPFLTEEIFSNLIHKEESIMISNWPTIKDEFKFKDEEKKTQILMDAIKKVRNSRVTLNVPTSRQAGIILLAKEKQIQEMFTSSVAFLSRMANINEVKIVEDKNNIPATAVANVIDGGEIFIPLEDLIDISKEIDRLTMESEKLQQEINRVDGKLSNEKFVNNAPQKVVDAEKEKRDKYKEMKLGIDDRIKVLSQN